MHRYLAVISQCGDLESSTRFRSLESTLLSSPGWRTAYRREGVLVVHQPQLQRCPSIHLFANDQGVVLGSLFRRTTDPSVNHPVGNLAEAETGRIVYSGGRHLVREYWGTYVALFCDAAEGEYRILRDPSANLPCYHVKWGTMHVYFSDVESFRRYIPVPLSVNRLYLAAHLIAGLSSSRICGVNEIEDIPGGESMTISKNKERRTVLWHPGNFCAEDGLENQDIASRELRAAVMGAVTSLASEHEKIMIQLSGGLDSSIVTSCLAQHESKPDATCLNFYITGDSVPPSTYQHIPGLAKDSVSKLRRVLGSADERIFARKVAERCGFGLLEKERFVNDLNFDQLYGAPLLPRPSAYAYNLDVDVVQTDVATSTGATACFTGQGGDTVFFATQRAIGAVDYAFLHPLGPRLTREIFNSATISRESLASVMGKVIKHSYLRAPFPQAYDLLQRPHLLRDEVAFSISNCTFEHPWIATCPPLCPGKRDHVLGVAISAPQYQLVYHSENSARAVHPLASQPVVETSLRIPTYVLLADGVSRGLARRAFRDLIPAEIYKRTVKGTGMAYHQNIVRHNLSAIREHLLDGPLVREELLDRAKAESFLTVEQPFLTVQATQILEYLACDAWLTQMHPLQTSTK